jgi:hypothetical protein
MIDDELLDKKRTNREISNANLVPVKPGEVRNPEGRPPNKRFLSEIARELMKQARKGDLEGKTTDELVVLALVKSALQGNTKAIEMLHDWTEGKVPDKHEIETGDISIVYVPKKVDKDG